MPEPTSLKVPIRDAATVILVKQTDEGAAVLLGKRGAGAVFMPSKFVFPGGAVDECDDAVPGTQLAPDVRHKLSLWSNCPAEHLAACAIRELWEETGLLLARPGSWPGAPQAWAGFAEAGLLPDMAALRYVCRAITPKGRNRRFDARFFLVQASSLAKNPDDFAAADGELSDLQWVPLTRLDSFDLPYITRFILTLLRPQLLGAPGPDPVQLCHTASDALLDIS